MDLGYCFKCKEMNFALANNNGIYERVNMSNNHVGDEQHVFDKPDKYSPPIRTILTKLYKIKLIGQNPKYINFTKGV